MEACTAARPVPGPHGPPTGQGEAVPGTEKLSLPLPLPEPWPLVISSENGWVPGVCLWPRERRGLKSTCSSPGIVISSSAASPSEGTSSDSCLTSAGDGLAGLGGRLAAQGLVGTCSPLRLASPLLGAQSATPVLQAQGAPGGVTLLPISFQEGRRASDTSLTQGDFCCGAHFPFPEDALCPPRALLCPGAEGMSPASTRARPSGGRAPSF